MLAFLPLVVGKPDHGEQYQVQLPPHLSSFFTGILKSIFRACKQVGSIIVVHVLNRCLDFCGEYLSSFFDPTLVNCVHVLAACSLLFLCWPHVYEAEGRKRYYNAKFSKRRETRASSITYTYWSTLLRLIILGKPETEKRNPLPTLRCLQGCCMIASLIAVSMMRCIVPSPEMEIPRVGMWRISSVLLGLSPFVGMITANPLFSLQTLPVVGTNDNSFIYEITFHCWISLGH